MASKLVKELFRSVYEKESTERITEFNKLLLDKYRYDEDVYFDKAYNLLGYAYQGHTFDQLIDYIKTGNDPCFDELKTKQQQHDYYMTTPYDSSTDGVVKCAKCGSQKTVSHSKQTRGSDEAMTVFSKCLDCNFVTKT